MKKILLAIAAILSLYGCRNSVTRAEDLDMTNSESTSITADLLGVDKIIANGAYDIVYTPGDAAFSLSGSSSTLSHLVVEKDGSTLKIGTDGTKFLQWKGVSISMSTPTLEKLECNGAVDFEAPRGIIADNLSLTVNGAGDIEIQGLEANYLSVNINGAGDIDLDGIEIKEVKVTVNGAGDISLSGNAESLALVVNGAGSADISELTCPEVVTRRNGIGSIKRHDD